MLDRRVLRWCGLAAVVAGVVGLLILIKNLLHFMEHHPKSRHASHDANLETELETISDSFTWLLTNYAEGIVAGLVLVGAVGILASMRDEPSRSWARIAIPAVVAGSVVYGLTIATTWRWKEQPTNTSRTSTTRISPWRRASRSAADNSGRARSRRCSGSLRYWSVSPL